MTHPSASLDERADALRRRCDRTLLAHPPRTAAQWLATLAEVAGDAEPDRYGAGALLAGFEARVAELLGTEAAVFVPSGTLAQQAALRTWAESTGVPGVALHPLAHIDKHELRGLWELHGLRPLYLTDEPRQPVVDDLATVTEPLGSVVVELPLRDAGYLLPTFDELTAFCAAARERDAAVHVDGARLWESAAGMGRSPAELVALADSVYVSFYKILDGLSGAAVAGSELLVSSVRRWQHRHGGRLVTHFPAVLAAQRGLDELLPRVPAYVEHARVLAAAVTAARVFPEPPQLNSFRLYFDAPADRMLDAALAYAEERSTWTWRWFVPAGVPGWCWVEVSVGEATMSWSATEFADLVAELLDRARPR